MADESGLASPYEAAQARYQEQLNSLIKRQNDLVESLDSRQNTGNPLLALAQGFLAPTRGGGFGESASNALQSMAAQQQQEQKQSQETAMMRMQLAQASLAPYKEQMEMVRRAGMSSDIRNMLSGKPETITGPQAANVARSVGVAPFSNEAASLIGTPTQSGGNNLFGQIDPTTRRLLSAQASVDPESVMKDLITFRLKEEGSTDDMKSMRFFAQQFPGADQAKLMQVVAAKKLLGDPTSLITAISSVTDKIDQEIDVPTNRAIKEYLMAQLKEMQGLTSPTAKAQTTPSVSAEPKTEFTIPKNASQEQASKIINSSVSDPAIQTRVLEDFMRSSPQQTTSQVTKTSDEGLNKQQRAIRDLEERERLLGRVKEQIKERTTLKNAFDASNDNLSISDQVYNIVSNNQNAFGILSKPGFASAIGGLVQEALRVGNYSIGIPGIQDAIRKLGGTQADIDAVSKFDQLAVNLALGIASSQKGQGTISNFEREMFAKAALSTNDSANVLMYKSELLRARATMDKIRWNNYYEYEKSKKGNIEDYKMSPQYQKLRDNYESTLRDIAKTYQK